MAEAQSAMEKDRRSLSLLLVDDDVELCVMMKEYFCAFGHRLDFVHNGRTGHERIICGNYDLVILDVMLPELDGLTLLEDLQSRVAPPVIMLTARTQRQDRILGLRIGADDYLPKPFDPDELLARINAVLRRASPGIRASNSIISVGKIRLDGSVRRVWSSGDPVELTSLEFDLLELLMRSKGSVVSRERITTLLFGREATPFDRFLDVHISHLRKKLNCGRDLIRAIRGVGYVFAAMD
jgi:DNA-binding response OmpR family regulator